MFNETVVERSATKRGGTSKTWRGKGKGAWHIKHIVHVSNPKRFSPEDLQPFPFALTRSLCIGDKGGEGGGGGTGVLCAVVVSRKGNHWEKNFSSFSYIPLIRVYVEVSTTCGANGRAFRSSYIREGGQVLLWSIFFSLSLSVLSWFLNCSRVRTHTA